jgi:hypothetical protein
MVLHIQSHGASASAVFEREGNLALWNPKTLRPSNSKPGRNASTALESGLNKR